MRKEKLVKIQDRGRELTFKIKEMPASQAERWIIRLGLLLAGTGLVEKSVVQNDAGATSIEIGKLLASSGIISALAKIDYEKAAPLYDELLGCCSYVVSGAMDQPLTPELVDGIVEDVKTLFLLRKEAAMLNFDFFSSVFLSSTLPSEAESAPRQAPRGAKISVN